MPSLSDQVDALFAPWDKPDSPGCAIGVIRDGDLIYARGYGAANLDYDIPLTPDSVFLVASMSKQFTAACILLLEQRGALSLDDDARRHIPELPDYGPVIRVRHLLHHTSGLRSSTTLMMLAGQSFEGYYGNADAIKLLARQTALDFAPGEAHVYCNSGYVLLAEIVARVSGQSLVEFAQDSIFDRLGMSRTSFVEDHARVIRNRVISYGHRPDGAFRQFFKTDRVIGPTGLLTTINDLYRWDQNFYHAKVGGTAFVDRMLEPGRLNDGAQIHYASGLAHGQYRGLDMVWHGGMEHGFRSQMMRFPEQAFTAICLANVEGFNPARLLQRVADLYLADAFTEPRTEFIDLPVERLQEWSGLYYDAPSGVSVRVSIGDGRLFADMFGMPVPYAPIRLDDAGSVALQELAGPMDTTLTLSRPAPDRPRQLSLQVGMHRLPMLTAFDAEEARPDRLAEYVGEYDSDELQSTYAFTLIEGALQVSVAGMPPFPIESMRGDLFRIDGQALLFMRDGAGRVSGFTLTGPMARNVRFVK